MKLHLKPTEHLRIVHDSTGGVFRVTVDDGVLTVLALSAGDIERLQAMPGQVVIVTAKRGE